MCQNQHTAHLRSSDSSQRENKWLSYTAISHNEFQGILQNPHKIRCVKNFLGAHTCVHQMILMEDLDKHVKQCIGIGQLENPKSYQKNISMESFILDENQFWNSKDPKTLHKRNLNVESIGVTTASFLTRNLTFSISKLPCFPSQHLKILEQSQIQAFRLLSSDQYTLKLNDSITSFSIFPRTSEIKTWPSSVTLNCDLGPTSDSSRPVIENNDNIKSNFQLLRSLNASKLHQKSADKVPIQISELLTCSNHCMHPRLSRMPHSKLSPEFSQNPKLHASMVGSYEECLIHGRMSTTPSRQFDFFAELGVLGMKKSSKHLKFPPHINIPFPAVFYSYESLDINSKLGLDAGQSPYVGLIDLEKRNLNQSITRTPPLSRAGARYNSKREYRKNQIRAASFSTNQAPGYKICGVKKGELRSKSSSLPPTGGYRIPKIGQLQLIIRNPNKTPVKVFIVPYNLSEMKPGTKTFIRQRIFLTKIAVDESLKPNTSSSKAKNSNPQILRSLVHFQICSPCLNQFYLYKDIKLVFENRITDCSEKLSIEVLLPEPRYSIYNSERKLNH
ncbi:hypothetical protein EV44_g5599 [Erysiphe necator]|uniref:Atos-like conserved domain-containing protein n=1 Tax=Uncinula necator TaxID=52586 RepID=A0A0B1PD23_UNCNE|nr:hypothetical protein EV44_g5599 [Erysiphe necator]